MTFEDLLQQEALGEKYERNRLRKVESPLPGREVQEIGMLIISPALDERLARVAKEKGESVGEVIVMALDALMREGWSGKED